MLPDLNVRNSTFKMPRELIIRNPHSTRRLLLYLKSDGFFKTRKFDLIANVLATMKLRQQKQIQLPRYSLSSFSSSSNQGTMKAFLAFEILIGSSVEIVDLVV